MLLKRRTVASYHSSTAIAEGDRAILILCRKRFEDLTGNSETTLRNGVCCLDVMLPLEVGDATRIS